MKKQKAKQQSIASGKASKQEAQAHNRQIGLAGFSMGIIFAIGTLAGFIMTGRILIVTTAIALGGIGLGLYMLITGRQ